MFVFQWHCTIIRNESKFSIAEKYIYKTIHWHMVRDISSSAFLLFSMSLSCCVVSIKFGWPCPCPESNTIQTYGKQMLNLTFVLNYVDNNLCNWCLFRITLFNPLSFGSPFYSGCYHVREIGCILAWGLVHRAFQFKSWNFYSDGKPNGNG